MSQLLNSSSGGGGGVVSTLTGDVGVATAAASNINVITGLATNHSGSSIDFFGSGDTLELNLTDINHNTLLGNSAGNLTLSGSSNTGIGYTVLNGLTSGTSNVAVGALALSGITTGTANTALGNTAGSAYTGAETDNISIGQGVTGTLGESNVTRIGTGQSKCFISGIDGINVGSVARVVTEASDQLGTAVITAGTGISVTPAANLITIAATGLGAFSWSVITANQTAAVNHGYFCNKAGTLALALPATSAVGDTIEVTNENTALGVQFTQAAGQQILIGNTNTTLGATGTLTTSAVGDTLRIVCKVANTVWRTTSMVGNWSPA